MNLPSMLRLIVGVNSQFVSIFCTIKVSGFILKFFPAHLTQEELKSWYGQATGIRCSYCNGQGPVVACSTCINHACVLRVGDLDGCVGREEFGNQNFRCPGCLIRDRKPILVRF